VGWYAHIHEAMDDLQTQLKRMELAKATPEQFGLAVRSHPESLIVTARNKMGTGKEFPVKVSLAGRLIETTRIRAESDQLKLNLDAGIVLARRSSPKVSHRNPYRGGRSSDQSRSIWSAISCGHFAPTLPTH
jgi:hypothetical protein